MKISYKKTLVSFIAVTLLSSQSVSAARMGKSRSAGIQRSSIGQKSYNSGQPANPTQNYSNSNGSMQEQTRRGPGVGTVVAGAAAGAVGGYMLGKAMNSNEKAVSSQANNQTQNMEEPRQSPGHQIPWGIITILGLLLVIGLIIFKRRTPQPASQSFNSNPSNNNSFNIPNIRKDSYPTHTSANPSLAQGSNKTLASYTLNNTKMADGIEAPYFLRQAKGMFLHIQSMNTPENLTEVAKYMIPELYEEIKDTISSNDYPADFSNLNCELLESNLENETYIASVKFFGKISESPDSPVIDFCEIWNFTKPTTPNARWLVAGIQQTKAN